jgi:hypothetical protein
MIFTVFSMKKGEVPLRVKETISEKKIKINCDAAAHLDGQPGPRPGPSPPPCDSSLPLQAKHIITYSSVTTSVADPGCLSPNPDFFHTESRLTATKERDEKKIFVEPFIVATNITKL